jgi:hypothetical protein
MYSIAISFASVHRFDHNGLVCDVHAILTQTRLVIWPFVFDIYQYYLLKHINTKINGHNKGGFVRAVHATRVQTRLLVWPFEELFNSRKPCCHIASCQISRQQFGVTYVCYSYSLLNYTILYYYRILGSELRGGVHATLIHTRLLV